MTHLNYEEEHKGTQRGQGAHDFEDGAALLHFLLGSILL